MRLLLCHPGSDSLFCVYYKQTFTLFTFGAGLSWATEEGKVRSLDLAAEFGGDSFNVAAGDRYEF